MTAIRRRFVDQREKVVQTVESLWLVGSQTFESLWLVGSQIANVLSGIPRDISLRAQRSAGLPRVAWPP
jgi:hypothetical protein